MKAEFLQKMETSKFFFFEGIYEYMSVTPNQLLLLKQKIKKHFHFLKKKTEIKWEMKHNKIFNAILPQVQN